MEDSTVYRCVSVVMVIYVIGGLLFARWFSKRFNVRMKWGMGCYNLLIGLIFVIIQVIAQLIGS